MGMPPDPGLKLSFTIVGKTARRMIALAKDWNMQTNALVEELLVIALEGKDQTNRDWINGIEPTQLGTGIFLIPDVEKNEYGTCKQVVVGDIGYHDCIRRGLHAKAFKWVPHTIAPEEQVSGGSCRVPQDRRRKGKIV